jgi:hypothetical protein
MFGIKLKYSYTIIYDYEKSPLAHELCHIELFSLKFVSFLRSFFLSWYPNWKWIQRGTTNILSWETAKCEQCFFMANQSGPS